MNNKWIPLATGFAFASAIGVGYQMVNLSLKNKMTPYESIVKVDYFEGRMFEFSFDALPQTAASANLAIVVEGNHLDAMDGCKINLAGDSMIEGRFTTVQIGDQQRNILTVELPTNVLAKWPLCGNIDFLSPLENARVRVRLFGWSSAKNFRAKHPAQSP